MSESLARFMIETTTPNSVQRTCWATGAVIRMCDCGIDTQPVSPCLPVYTDGRDEWAYCPKCKKTWDTQTLKERHNRF